MSLKKITLTFDSAWVLSKREEDTLPVAALLSALQKKLAVKVLSSSLTDCEIVLEDASLDADSAKIRVADVLQQVLGLQPGSDVVELSVSDYEAPAEAPKQTPEAKENKPTAKAVPTPVSESPAQEAAKTPQEVLAAIDALVGAEEFKALAHELADIAPGIIKYNTYEALRSQCYLFAINDGNGMTTCLRLLTELLQSLGLVEFTQDPVVEAKAQPAQPNKPAEECFRDITGHMNRLSATGKAKLICADISEWMSDVNSKDFRQFLTTVENQHGPHIVVFRIPFVEKDILHNLAVSLSDQLLVREVAFVPFDCDELTTCAQEALEQRGFAMAEDAWEVFHARIAEEKTDGKFYGINTVNKVIREMILLKLRHNAKNGVDDALVKRGEILTLAATFDDSYKSGLEILDEMIGMETLKQRVEEIVAQIETSMKNKDLGSPCVHMRFVGNPGTGKTTVARVIGKILKEKGILRNGNFFEHSGRDFCGRYVGETAPKTAAMCRDAYGSVLFIDEAYSLYRGGGFSTADYGQEALDTLIAEMENHRSDLVVIMAGYPDEMGELMKGNAGLASRMPYIIEFPNYTREQLKAIFMKMAKKSFTFREDFSAAVAEYFDQLPQEVIEAKEFSNARFVRNLFERTWGKAVLRAQLNKTEPNVLLKEDFLAASAEKEFGKMMHKTTIRRTVGFL